MIADTKTLNKKIAEKIIFLLKTEKHGEEMKQKVLYSLQVILSEVEKLLIFLFVFAVCNMLQEFLISYIVLVSIRIYVGGNHCKTSIGCIIYTLIMYSIILAGAKYIPLNRMAEGILEILCVISIWKNEGSLPKNRMTYSQNTLLKFKVRAFTVLVVDIIIMEFTSLNYKNVILWTLLIQVIDAFLANVVQKRSELVHAKHQ